MRNHVTGGLSAYVLTLLLLSAASAGELQNVALTHTGPCVNPEQTLATWVNQGSQPVRIKKAFSWISVPNGTQVQVYMQLRAQGRIMSWLGFDHFTNFTSLQQAEHDFGADYFTVNPNQQVTMVGSCRLQAGTNSVTYLGMFWYTF
jgi:hypothetical protein